MTVTTATHAPGVSAPWMPALETQLACTKLIDQLIGAKSYPELHDQWTCDEVLLRRAVPFAWSNDPILACLSASDSIPPDTSLNSWNLNTDAAWWHFENPLPYQTLDVSPHTDGVLTGDEFSKLGVRAILIGWVHTKSSHVKLPAGTPVKFLDAILNGEATPYDKSLGVSVWVDDPKGRFDMIPSQTWFWRESETLGGMIERTQKEHHRLYGPGGKWEKKSQVGEALFMAATEGISRFVLAGLAWLNQKVLVESSGHVERHRRKDFNRTMKQDLDAVRVVSLRKVERPKSDSESSPEGRDYKCRWTVDGHFRNQACGPGHAQRRLTWVSPYIKGPDDMPMRVPQHKVYTVKR